jgi:hypothetical protein
MEECACCQRKIHHEKDGYYYEPLNVVICEECFADIEEQEYIDALLSNLSISSECKKKSTS